MAGMTSEGKLLNLIKDAQKKHRLRKDLKVFTKINIVLIALILVILIVFLVDFLASSQEKSTLMVELPEEETVLPLVEDVDIEEEIVIEERPLASKEELVKDLTVLGIITGDNDQVIIEDKAAGKTNFLYKDDSFGDFKINEIKDNGVILDYKGEKIELNM